jgi:hypothetical protein
MGHFALTRRDDRLPAHATDRARLDSLVEASIAELSHSPAPRRLLGCEPWRGFEADPDFGSPNTTPRSVRANFVSCHPPSGAIKAITGPDPVGVIQAANTRAIELLDYVIRDLQGKRDKIRASAATAATVEDIPTREALRTRFRMNADDRSIWTGSGARTVLTLIRRFQGARQILADGWLRYTCLGAATITLGKCDVTEGNGCTADTRAVSCGGHSRIVLCAPWWSDDLGINMLDAQARTLLHEALHIYFGFIGDRESGNFANAHCYDQFVFDMNWLDVPTALVGSCP